VTFHSCFMLGYVTALDPWILTCGNRVSHVLIVNSITSNLPVKPDVVT
jgi:hypothetical protein